MSKVVLTIDCDFVFSSFLDILNDLVLSNTMPMNEFVEWLKSTDRYGAYREMMKPDHERVVFVNNIIKKHMSKNKRIVFIKDHQDILRYVDKENDIIFNIDYHEDMDMDEKELFCGNWANDVKNYQWFGDIDDFAFDMDYDCIIMTYSPEWTPDIYWVENLYIRKKLAELVKV
ncbi:MAG: hypothetical protein ACRDD8_16035 [Bacteroidales bacterium]